MLKLQSVLCNDAWHTAHSPQAISDRSFLQVVGASDGLACVVLGDRGLESPEDIARMALAVVGLGTVEGSEEGRQECRRAAHPWHCEAGKDSCVVVALPRLVSTILFSDASTAVPFANRPSHADHEGNEDSHCSGDLERADAVEFGHVVIIAVAVHVHPHHPRVVPSVVHPVAMVLAFVPPVVAMVLSVIAVMVLSFALSFVFDDARGALGYPPV